VCAAIVGMTCDVVCALVMLISLLGLDCIVAPAFRSLVTNEKGKRESLF